MVCSESANTIAKAIMDREYSSGVSVSQDKNMTFPKAVKPNEIKVNAAAPMATSVFVLKPALRWRHCLSKPITKPSPIAKEKRSKKSVNTITSINFDAKV